MNKSIDALIEEIAASAKALAAEGERAGDEKLCRLASVLLAVLAILDPRDEDHGEVG